MTSHIFCTICRSEFVWIFKGAERTPVCVLLMNRYLVFVSTPQWLWGYSIIYERYKKFARIAFLRTQHLTHFLGYDTIFEAVPNLWHHVAAGDNGLDTSRMLAARIGTMRAMWNQYAIRSTDTKWRSHESTSCICNHCDSTIITTNTHGQPDRWCHCISLWTLVHPDHGCPYRSSVPVTAHFDPYGICMMDLFSNNGFSSDFQYTITH